MKKTFIISLLALLICSFDLKTDNKYYREHYFTELGNFEAEQLSLLNKIQGADLNSEENRNRIKGEIAAARVKLKSIDIWLRYLEPVVYKQVNGPLPVEWENEVFEKYEKPYKREGAGLTLAELYLDEKNVTKDSLMHLIQLSAKAVRVYREDSITRQLDTFDHFFLCNRLYLLNLSGIYTTGFDCPDTKRVIPELRAMVADVRNTYAQYNRQFPATAITRDYMELYDRTVTYVNAQPADFALFDHFTFIKNYVNPLFAINQRLIRQYNVLSNSFNDYTLSNDCNSIFDKGLYMPQNTKGIYSLIQDTAVLNEVRAVGKLLFYDPILSSNNQRSCASCHKPKEYFTDTAVATSFNFDHDQRLARNTPTLINVIYNHLIMLDGKHISLQNQGKDVMTNSTEMSGDEHNLLEKVLSCKEYKNTFRKLLKLTPEEKEIGFTHLVSAITFYYGGFSKYYSPFDDAMNRNAPLGRAEVSGFNIFMSKGQCATCHFAPQFNGVPPPYIGSEFEVIGVPDDKKFSKLNGDKGRYEVNPAFETMNAFRTGTIRNAEHTKPYMHNGVFNTLDEVIDFYDAGGGAGRGLTVVNQSLPADSLRLTVPEKADLRSFLLALSEHVIFEEPPARLPASPNKELNGRKVSGEY